MILYDILTILIVIMFCFAVIFPSRFKKFCFWLIDEEDEDEYAIPVKDEVGQRFAALIDEVGVEYRTRNVFGEIVVLNDGSYGESGAFGPSYYFSNGDSYEMGVFGYTKGQKWPVK